MIPGVNVEWELTDKIQIEVHLQLTADPGGLKATELFQRKPKEAPPNLDHNPKL